MNFNEYQEKALRTARENMDFSSRLLMGALGLGGEAGEVIELVKKREFHGKPLSNAAIRDELGDVLWYLSFLADAFLLPLESIAEHNIKKLEKRYPSLFVEGGGIRDDV